MSKYPRPNIFTELLCFLTLKADISLNGVNNADMLCYICAEVTFASKNSDGEKSISKAGPHIIAVTCIKTMTVAKQEKTIYAFCTSNDLA